MKNKYYIINFFLCIFVFTHNLCFAEIQHAYINMSGQILFKAPSDDAGSFSDGLAPVKLNGKWGFINPLGKWVIQPQYDRVGSFREGLAAAKIGDKYGYIDKKGNIIILPQWSPYIPSFFSEGLAVVMNGVPPKFYVIDKKGKVLNIGQFDSIEAFSDGLAKVNNYTTHKTGYINTSGKFVVEPQMFDYAADFHDGRAHVLIEGKRGYIDKTGKMIFQASPECGDFSEGLVYIVINNLYGYADKSGAIIIKPQFTKAGNFSGGLAPVKIGTKYGYINKMGKIVIQPQFEYAYPFSDGLALIKK